MSVFVLEEIIVRPRRIKSSLNKEVLKENIHLNDFNNFKRNLLTLINETNKAGSKNQGEENVKNHLIEFLKESFYKKKHSLNTMSYKGRNEADLVIHSGLNQDSNVSVIFEVKTLKNKTEMLSRDIIENKSPSSFLKESFYEAVLYFFHEVMGKNNIELKTIIITNVFEYFIFDASEFKRVFIDKSKILSKTFEKWKNKELIDDKTDTFYNQVKEYITNHPEYLNNLRFTYFDIREIKEDEELKLLYKVFSPKHLLKQASANDSNTLNKDFYNELLHVIGLEEVEKGSQKLIQRKKERDSGSLLENTIKCIQENDKYTDITNKPQFGNTKEEVVFNVALSLCIRWVNRILFLKLLEGQLFNYHNGDKEYKFLTFSKIKTFKRLNRLFFSVLAKKSDERDEEVQKEFFRIPYLNSSLFENSDLEKQTIKISSLEDDLSLSIYKSTILKDENKKKLKTSLPTLEYLLNFLNSYDFGAEENISNEFSEESKTLINASVLGLIFEKINGYKDGSFYTPSFITTYMCREAISKVIIQKFNQKYNWEIESIEELSDFILRKKIPLKDSNDLVNSIKICDPAVGSGHFLVSTLNEIIAIKSQLYILCDSEYKKLSVTIENQNDELVIKDLRTDDIFEYKVKNYTNYAPVSREIIQESTRIQKALFIQKKTLIENCLFGVDINNNSVMICGLRLWIELLKNAFYTEESNYKELETLPNIDINIKKGNSLISRYDFDVNLKTVFNKTGFSAKEYRDKVKKYKETNSKDIKEEILKYIEDIKNEFKTEISDKELGKIQSVKNEINQMGSNLFGLDKETKKKIVDRNKKLDELLKQKEEVEKGELYKDAFEWRFMFPEVLDEKGDFIGFDAIIGNPPYIQIQSFTVIQKESWRNQNYQTFEATGDIYCLFYERGNQLLKNNGFLSYITSNKWMRAGYGESTRKYFVENTNPLQLLDFSQNLVFDTAIVHSNILLFQKSKSKVNEIETIDANKGLKKETLVDFCDITKQTGNKIIDANKGLKPLVQKIFDDEKTYHITWVTHNSRISERMIEFKVKTGKPLILNMQQELEITKYIFDIAQEKNFKVLAYNICNDHVHIVLSCKESELDNIVCTLKSKSTYLYKKNNNISDSINIWAQKYNCSYIETEKQFYNTIEYVKNNRKKHNLTENKELLTLIEQGALVPCNSKIIHSEQAEKTENLSLVPCTPDHLASCSSSISEKITDNSSSIPFNKELKQNNLEACSIFKDFNNTSLETYFRSKKVILSDLNQEIWNILTFEEYDIKKKVEKIGTPLKNWNISIYRGILTGFNEAFIIDGKKKSELIKEDPKNAEIIKPILRGRDVRSYFCNFSDLWLINTHNGYKNLDPIDILKYPYIRYYLDSYFDKLKERLDKGITPYNLRNCAYLDHIEKEKIVFSEIVSEPQFHLDKKGYYPEASAFFISGENLKYLIALLNSKVVTYFFTKFYAGGDLVGKYRYKKAFLENLPIPQISKEAQEPYETMVELIIYAKENGFENEAKTFETVVNSMVYDLYFPDEMKEGNCYITDRIKEKVKPFRDDDTDEFKKEYINSLSKFFSNDKIVYGGLIYSRFIDVVKIIDGKKDE